MQGLAGLEHGHASEQQAPSFPSSLIASPAQERLWACKEQVTYISHHGANGPGLERRAATVFVLKPSAGDTQESSSSGDVCAASFVVLGETAPLRRAGRGPAPSQVWRKQSPRPPGAGHHALPSSTQPRASLEEVLNECLWSELANYLELALNIFRENEKGLWGGAKVSSNPSSLAGYRCVDDEFRGHADPPVPSPCPLSS